jgi:hypothetical protein
VTGRTGFGERERRPVPAYARVGPSVHEARGHLVSGAATKAVVGGAASPDRHDDT